MWSSHFREYKQQLRTRYCWILREYCMGNTNVCNGVIVRMKCLLFVHPSVYWVTNSTTESLTCQYNFWNKLKSDPKVSTGIVNKWSSLPPSTIAGSQSLNGRPGSRRRVDDELTCGMPSQAKSYSVQVAATLISISRRRKNPAKSTWKLWFHIFTYLI